MKLAIKMRPLFLLVHAASLALAALPRDTTTTTYDLELKTSGTESCTCGEQVGIPVMNPVEETILKKPLLNQ